MGITAAIAGGIYNDYSSYPSECNKAKFEGEKKDDEDDEENE